MREVPQRALQLRALPVRGTGTGLPSWRPERLQNWCQLKARCSCPCRSPGSVPVVGLPLWGLIGRHLLPRAPGTLQRALMETFGKRLCVSQVALRKSCVLPGKGQGDCSADSWKGHGCLPPLKGTDAPNPQRIQQTKPNREGTLGSAPLLPWHPREREKECTFPSPSWEEI